MNHLVRCDLTFRHNYQTYIITRDLSGQLDSYERMTRFNPVSFNSTRMISEIKIKCQIITQRQLDWMEVVIKIPELKFDYRLMRYITN